MKILLAFLCATTAFHCLAQSGNFLGRRVPDLKPPKKANPPPPTLRVVTNQLFNIEHSVLWKEHEVMVQEVGSNYFTGYLLTSRGAGGDVLVFNGGTPASGSQLKIRAMGLGLTNQNGHASYILDCGTLPTDKDLAAFYEHQRKPAIAITNSPAK